MQESLPSKRSASELDDLEEPEESEDVMVSVAGEMKKLSDLTDEDKERMTSEEYSQYYEVYMQSMQ